MPAPPQAQEQRAVADPNDEGAGYQPSADTAREIKTEKPKDAGDLQESIHLGIWGVVSCLAKDFLRDQEQIWTSLRVFRFSDTEWLVRLAEITRRLFVTRTREFTKHLSTTSTISPPKQFRMRIEP